MEIKEFSGNMKEAVQKLLGEGHTVETVSITKNNNVTLEALVIRQEQVNLAPTIYLNNYFEAHLNGESIRKCAERLVGDYLDAIPDNDLDTDFYRDYECVRRGLSYKLISTERNRELLESVPHVPFLDLDIVFYYSLDRDGMPEGSILIRNTHKEMWGVSTEDLMRDAMESAPLTSPETCRDMYSVVKKMQESGEYPEDEFLTDIPEMYILTNKSMVFGAAVILYPGIMSRLSDKLEGNLYIIPSSIHEVIVLPDNGYENVDQLREMIYTVNRTQLRPQDILSDSLYYFDRSTEKITIAS